MKNYLKLFVATLLVLIATGCGSKTLTKNSSVEDLFDVYMEGFKNADPDKIVSVFPDFSQNFYKQILTKELIQAELDRYGDNLEMSYEIRDKVKLTNDELNQFNELIKQAFTNYVLPTECYEIKGTTIIKGSKDEYTAEMAGTWYCSFDGTWRLLEDL